MEPYGHFDRFLVILIIMVKIDHFGILITLVIFAKTGHFEGTSSGQIGVLVNLVIFDMVNFEYFGSFDQTWAIPDLVKKMTKNGHFWYFIKNDQIVFTGPGKIGHF